MHNALMLISRCSLIGVIVFSLCGCGLYIMNQNSDIVNKLNVGTPKSNIIADLKTGYDFGNKQPCENVGVIEGNVFEKCPVALSASDLFSNNIFFVNDKYIGSGNDRLFFSKYFDEIDMNPILSNYQNKSVILISRISDGAGPLHAKLPRIGIVDIYVNGKKVGSLNGDETSFMWDQMPGDVTLEVKQKERILNQVFVNVEKGHKYHLVYNYSNGAIHYPGDESSQIIFTSIPSGALVYVGTEPNTLKPTFIITPHTVTRMSDTHKWNTEYYKMTLDGYKDSPVVFRNNSYGDPLLSG